MKEEKIITLPNGYLMLLIFTTIMIGSVLGMIYTGNMMLILLMLIALFVIVPGFVLVQPNPPPRVASSFWKNPVKQKRKTDCIGLTQFKQKRKFH